MRRAVALGFLAGLAAGAVAHVERRTWERMAALEARIMALDQQCDDFKERYASNRDKE